MLANIAHFHLEASRVIGHIGQHAPLEQLHQYVFLGRADFGAHPIGIADRQAQGEQPVSQLACARHATFQHRPRLIHKIPEDLRNIMAGVAVVLRNRRLGV